MASVCFAFMLVLLFSVAAVPVGRRTDMLALPGAWARAGSWSWPVYS